MRIEALSTIISVAGLCFFTATLAIIVLGKKVGDNDGPQRVSVGKYVDVTTNSVLMLALITLIPAFGPLALKYWKPDLANYIPREELIHTYLPLKDLSLIVHGAVLLDTGRFADDVQIAIVRTSPETTYTRHYQTDEQGQFYIELDGVKPKEHYDVTWSKSGYTKKTLRFGFNEIPFPLTLNREGGEQ